MPLILPINRECCTGRTSDRALPGGKGYSGRHLECHRPADVCGQDVQGSGGGGRVNDQGSRESDDVNGAPGVGVAGGLRSAARPGQSRTVVRGYAQGFLRCR